jgi:predicted RND superfamily exporter protein
MPVSNDLGVAATRPDTAVVAGALASTLVDVDDSPTASTTKTLRRARATQSDVWQDMEQVNNRVGGMEVRVPAICNYYKSRLLLLPHLLSLICILDLMVMFNNFSTILILLGLNLLI